MDAVTAGSLTGRFGQRARGVDRHPGLSQHEAMTHEPSDAVPAGHVIAELQGGYTMGDRVLRPSVVRVLSGPVSEPGTPAADQPDGDSGLN